MRILGSAAAAVLALFAYSTPALAQPPAGAPPGPPPPATAPGSAWVHVAGDPDIVLEARPPQGESWVAMCNAPCDRELPLDDSYRISGSGIQRSRVFTIAAQPGQHVVLEVSAHSTGGLVGGIVLASIGVVAEVTGLVLLLEGSLQSLCIWAPCRDNPSADRLKTAGWVFLLLGTAGTATGVVLIAVHARSRLSQRVGEPYARPERDDAWLRLPTWHEPSSLEAGLPRTQTLPILSRSF